MTGEMTGEVAPEDYLKRLGEAGDGPHDIATAALMLAALDHPEKRLDPFRAHLTELAEAARADAAFMGGTEGGARMLAGVFGRYGYDGDRLQYDNPVNADMISVIERRRGLPVALGILYIHAARAAGMDACGLFAPGHFLLKLTVKGNEALIDPFNGGALFERERLAAPLGAAHAFEHGEGDPFSPVGDTDVLLRLLNNIRSRARKSRDAARGADILRRMTVIAPKRAALWLELAKFYEAAGTLSSARAAYETCLAVASAGDGFRNEAMVALAALKRRLN